VSRPVNRPPVPRIASLATATGPHQLHQADAKALAGTLFAARHDPAELERHLRVFDHAGVRERQLCVGPGWFLEPHGFADRNRRWRSAAAELACRAGRRAVESAGLTPGDVDTLVVMATTGVSTPALDVDVMEGLGLPFNGTHHETVFGRGCAGGAVGLVHAARMAVAAPGSVVLAVAVEVCSVVRGSDDLALADLVGAALFADGAAAIVVSTAGLGPAIAGGASDLIPNSRSAMGWNVTDDGFGLVLDRSVPTIVRRQLAPSVERACCSWEIDVRDLDELVVHPGSARVLDAVERALGLDGHALDDSRAVLADHGNMSAPTVWFVLERTLARRPRVDHPTTALLTAMGPGFAIEHVLLRW
jgi:alkylresorcinol/alkylpyrone synthase